MSTVTSQFTPLADLFQEYRDSLAAWSLATDGLAYRGNADDWSPEAKQHWSARELAESKIVKFLEEESTRPECVEYDTIIYNIDYDKKSISFVYGVKVEHLDEIFRRAYDLE